MAACEDTPGQSTLLVSVGISKLWNYSLVPKLIT